MTVRTSTQFFLIAVAPQAIVVAVLAVHGLRGDAMGPFLTYLAILGALYALAFAWASVDRRFRRVLRRRRRRSSG